MKITPMTDDLRIIGSLSDLPNANEGLSAQELKEKFDEGPLRLQTWINDRFLPHLTAENLPFASSLEIPAENLQDAVEAVHSQVRDASTGTIVNGSVTREKLSSGLLERTYGGRAWVSLDVPGAVNHPAADFPIGQMWLRPGFTVENKAGSWLPVGCAVEKQETDILVTGSGETGTVSVTQNLMDLGQAGDRVYVLFGIADADPEITSMTLQINGKSMGEAGAGGVFAGAVAENGSVAVNLCAQWPSVSLAAGSFRIVNFAVVNVDAILRQTDDARDMYDWSDFLSGLLPLDTYRSPAQVYIQTGEGLWWMVNRFAQAGELMIGGKNGSLEQVDAPEAEGSFLQYEGSRAKWVDGETVVQSMDLLRKATGTYTGDGATRTIRLPVKPLFVFLYREGQETVSLADGHSRTANLYEDRNPYVCGVKLSGSELEFYREDGQTASAAYCNEADTAYTWVAIY